MHVADERLMSAVNAARTPREVTIERLPGEFPQQTVTVPDSWDTVVLAPLYDVHIGSAAHDAELFARHVRWIAETPNVLTWNGGDMIENASKMSVGAGVYEQDYDPTNQLAVATTQLASIAHKMLFTLPGNHEDRTLLAGVNLGRFLSWLLGVPFFPDYCFTTIKWRGNNFRLLAHHGSGSAQTAGAQRNAARKAIAWANGFDIYFTGHLHNALVDVIYKTAFDDAGEMYERSALVLIAPSYLKYFSTYAASKQYSPGTRGLIAITLQEDGRIDANVHARGRRQ